jgi:sugar lactone lactonase YvrE
MNPYANFIAIVDLYNKKIVADTRYSGDYPSLIGGSASNLALSPDGKYLYFATNSVERSWIFQYDTALHTYTRMVKPGDLLGYYGAMDSNANDLTISPDGRYLYFADSLYHGLVIMNLPDLSLHDRYFSLDTSLEPWSLAIRPDLARYYFSGSLRDDAGYGITKIEVPNYDPMNDLGSYTLEFSSLVSLIRLGPDGQTLYVVEPSPYDQRVIGYYVDNPSIHKIYSVGSTPDDVAFSPDGSKMYVYCVGNAYVMAFDLNTGLQLAGTPIVIGPDPHEGSGWSIGDIRRMYIGPVPQNDVFVNDSAYMAHQLSAVANLAPLSTGIKYAGSVAIKNTTDTG